jgi:cytochrome P450
MMGLTRTDDGWIASSHADVCMVLETGDLGVPEAPAAHDVGTVAWLRASVSRFCNGPEHERRRATVTELLDTLDAAQLREDALRRADTDRDHRHVVAATLAAALGAADPDAVATAVMTLSPAYFSGADDPAADAATQRLTELLADDDPDTVVARITVLVQACDATAGLIASATSGEPPLRQMRRVALQDTVVAEQPIAAGERVVCDIAAAGTDLTFGHGPRACPAEHHARALADGVLSTRQ